MIRLINPNSGGDTWVHESRLDEYLASGFRFAMPPMPAPPPVPDEEPVPVPDEEPDAESASDTPKKNSKKAR